MTYERAGNNRAASSGVAILVRAPKTLLCGRAMRHWAELFWDGLANHPV